MKFNRTVEEIKKTLKSYISENVMEIPDDLSLPEVIAQDEAMVPYLIKWYGSKIHILDAAKKFIDHITRLYDPSGVKKSYAKWLFKNFRIGMKGNNKNFIEYFVNGNFQTLKGDIAYVEHARKRILPDIPPIKDLNIMDVIHWAQQISRANKENIL